MGLTERRALAAFQESVFPGIKKEIDQIAGFEVSMEIKWETLGAEGYADSYPEFFSKVYFTPLVTAFKAICVDQMGKDSLKKSLKKVVIMNEKQFYSPESGFTFKDGILTLDHQPASNVDSVRDRETFLQKLLENSL